MPVKMYDGYFFFSFYYLFTDMLSADVYQAALRTRGSIHSISLLLQSTMWMEDMDSGIHG